MLVLGRSTRQSAKPCTSVCGIICDLVAGGVLLTRKILEFVFTALTYTLVLCLYEVLGTYTADGRMTRANNYPHLLSQSVISAHPQSCTQLAPATNTLTFACVYGCTPYHGDVMLFSAARMITCLQLLMKGLCILLLYVV